MVELSGAVHEVAHGQPCLVRLYEFRVLDLQHDLPDFGHTRRPFVCCNVFFYCQRYDPGFVLLKHHGPEIHRGLDCFRVLELVKIRVGGDDDRHQSSRVCFCHISKPPSSSAIIPASTSMVSGFPQFPPGRC